MRVARNLRMHGNGMRRVLCNAWQVQGDPREWRARLRFRHLPNYMSCHSTIWPSSTIPSPGPVFTDILLGGLSSLPAPPLPPRAHTHHHRHHTCAPNGGRPKRVRAPAVCPLFSQFERRGKWPSATKLLTIASAFSPAIACTSARLTVSEIWVWEATKSAAYACLSAFVGVRRNAV